MTVGQRVQQLTGPGQHVRLRQRALTGDTVGQVFSFHKIHHQVGVATFLEKVSDAHQMRVIEAGQDGGLLLELLAQLGQCVRV